MRLEDMTDKDLLAQCTGWNYQEALRRGLVDFDSMGARHLRYIVEDDKRYMRYQKLCAAYAGAKRGFWTVQNYGRNIESGRAFPVSDTWRPQHRALVHDAPRLIMPKGD
jgi:hypothetical protein